jgi:diketogulonate reductase-like aldo/keto reductase
MIERRAWGPTGVEVPVIGQGTWQMEEDGRAQCVRAIRAGLDAGLTHIDTAELYGRGEVEDIVGEAIAGRREDVFLVSKVLPSNASREGTVEACERSLRALRTDHLDSYLLHWPGPHPLEETIAGFEELLRGGKIRSWGVSNFDVEAMEGAVRIAGEGKIACNQVLYHVEERTIEHEVLPFCEAHGIALVGYSPYGSGRFPDDDPTLLRIAEAHGATPYQIALAFLTRHPATFTIPKAANAAHVVENARVVHLSEDELGAIDQAFPLGRSRRLPTL